MGKDKAKAEPLPADGDSEPPIVSEPGEGELESAIESLGQSVAAAESNVDLSEEAHVSAIERMERNATDAEIDVWSLIPDVRDFLLQTIKDRPKPWSATSNAEQRDVAAACEYAATELVRKIIEAVRSGGAAEPIRCLLVGFADKGDDIKVDLKVKAGDPESTLAAVLGLHKAKGKHVLVTVASIDDYRGDGREAELMDDQNAMDFEAGPIDDHPDDDSDLAGDDEGGAGPVLSEPGPAPIVRTGDVDDDGIEWRVNLATSRIEALPEGADRAVEASWTDERDATPDELAAERDRVADFAD